MVDVLVFIIVIEDVADIDTGTSGKAAVTAVTTIHVFRITGVTINGLASGDRAVSDNTIGYDVVPDDGNSGIASDIHIAHIKNTRTGRSIGVSIGVSIRQVIRTIHTGVTSII